MNLDVDFKEVFGGKYLGKNMVEEDLGQDPSFHPNGVIQVVNKNDAYFLGYRGNHFILVEGYFEELPDRDSFLLICNHKGTTIIKSFVEQK